MSAHRHRDSYAALVLDGNYVEASIDGRFSCSSGVLTVHPPWHTHANEFSDGGAVVLNFPMPVTDRLVSVRISNPQALADLARTSPVEAGYAASEEAECHEPAAPAPWLSSLAMSLLQRGVSPSSAAMEAGFCDQPHLTRLLKRATGMTPAKFASV
jgi:AraC-like DNA-binding protein